MRNHLTLIFLKKLQSPEARDQGGGYICAVRRIETLIAYVSSPLLALRVLHISASGVSAARRLSGGKETL